MLPSSEFRVIDVNATHWGVSVDALMEQAGCAVADLVMDRYPGEGKIAVVCGSGNNGGDGFVAARHLIPYRDVDVLLVKPSSTIRSDAAQRNFQLVEDRSMPFQGADLKEYSLVIDAALGLGVVGEIREPFATVIEALAGFRGPLVSVDCPSGLGGNKTVVPDVTVTFHDIKEGMDETECGEIVITDIGIPAEAVEFTGPGEAQRYPFPRPSSHKGENGRVLVVGGGPYTGAPALAGIAAYRAGGDLVRVMVPRTIHDIVSSYSPDLICHGLDGTFLQRNHIEEVLQLCERVDAVLIGPGLGNDEETLRAINTILDECDRPLVVDADAIAALGRRFQELKFENGAVITPHRRELEKLTGSETPDDKDELAEHVRATAAALGATILLKGQVDIVSDGRHIKYNRSGNVSMTVGGTGDVLAGIVAGLLSKGCSPYDSARLGVYINGVSGERAFENQGYGMIASDILHHIGPSMMDALEFGRGI